MSKPKHHSQDFVVTSVLWELDNESRHATGGFDPVSRETILRRYGQFIALLEREGMFAVPVPIGVEEMSEKSELRNSNLNDEGFEFARLYHGRWLDRTHKDGGAEKEQAFLEKWLRQFRARVSDTSGDR